MNPLPSKCLKPGFSKNVCPTIFFSTETEIKTSGALSQGRCGCRKELKLRGMRQETEERPFGMLKGLLIETR